MYMNISEITNENMIQLNLSAKSKKDAIEELCDVLYTNGKLIDKKKFVKAVLKREKKVSTGIGMGIAVPHAKSRYAKEASFAFGRSTDGIDFKSIDGTPAHFIFLIAVPEGADQEHLDILSGITMKLMHEEIRNSIYNAQSASDILKILE